MSTYFVTDPQAMLQAARLAPPSVPIVGLRGREVVESLRHVARHAVLAFHVLTGRHIGDLLSVSDFNSDCPAAWARASPGLRARGPSGDVVAGTDTVGSSD